MSSNAMVHEIFIQGYASNTTVNSTLRGVVAVCGTTLTVEPLDDQNKLTIVLNTSDVYDETQLFNLTAIKASNHTNDTDKNVTTPTDNDTTPVVPTVPDVVELPAENVAYRVVNLTDLFPLVSANPLLDPLDCNVT